MKGEDQEQRYVCKFCSKICVSGRSLGGHMRLHLSLISAKKDEENDDNQMTIQSGIKENPKKGTWVSEQSNSTLGQEGIENSNMDVDDGDQSGYGLRENPKKSWKLSDSKRGALQSVGRCEKCGKVFPSLRALTGHMRCHSMKLKEDDTCKICGKGFDSMRALFGHMRSHSKRSRDSIASAEIQSDLETVRPIRRKRSRTRYKISPSPTFSALNGASSITEIDQVKEAAMCLLMISRGMNDWNGFTLVTESLEYNSTGAQSYQHIEGIVEDGLKNSASLLEKNITEFSDFDSGAASNDEKKIEFGDPLDGSFEFDGFMNNKHDDGSATDFAEAGIVTYVGMGEADSRVVIVKPNSSKKAEYKDSAKKREYKCKTCDKMFQTYQALGGHRTWHKTGSCSFAVNMESCEKDIQTAIGSKPDIVICNGGSLEKEIDVVEVTNYASTKSKDHECPICFKVFQSGQALGGHKRAHYVGFCESRVKETMAAIKQEIPDIHDILDLNLPAAIEGKNNVSVGLKPWWAGSEALFISN